jgi:hypothetical protein
MKSSQKIAIARRSLAAVAHACYLRQLRLAEASRQWLQRKPVLARGPFSERSEISRRLENAPVVRGGSK